MHKKLEIMIGEKINNNLGLRQSARDFFEELNAVPEDDIVINFKNVIFVSRSFAHEYLKQKNQIGKCIEERYVPEDVECMFEVVRNSADKREISTLPTLPN